MGSVSFDLLTYWGPVALILVAVAGGAVVLRNAELVTVLEVAVTLVALVVLLSALLVIVIEWGPPPVG